MALSDRFKRIIVTRPDGQADDLLAAIRAFDSQPEVVHQPLINIVPFADDQSQAQLRQRMLNIDHYYAVVVVSKNAAEHGLAWLDKYWPQPPLDIHWITVGPATAEALAGEVEPLYMPADRYDSEGMLALPPLAEVAGEKVLIWRGNGGRETLAAELRRRGATVDYAELYERREIPYSSAQWHKLLDNDTLLLLSSGQALDIVEQQVPDLAQRVGAIQVPSQRVAERAAQQGYQQVLVAASARDQDVLAQLQN